MAEPDLKPCPFCGGEPLLISGGPGNHFVQCTDCNASSDDREQAVAIALWNRRSVTSQASEGVVVAWYVEYPNGDVELFKSKEKADARQDFINGEPLPLYATPPDQSKRVERLETANELIGGQSLPHIAELAKMLRALKVGQPVTVSSQFHEASMVLQALQGGRS